jgi:AdoMet-dependent heme synthase
MAMQRVLQKTWRENILFSALVELTYRCNLDCFFCYNDLSLRGRALSDADYFRLFADLADLQVMNLTLSGGEPLAHPSFLAFGRRARELGFVVRIKSNGHALRGELARRVRHEIDPFLFEISLHGATADAHDRQTRVPGSFDRLMENLPVLRDLGLRVKLNGTLTRWNEHQIEDMFELTDRLGLRFSLSPTVTPRDDGDSGPLAVAPSADGVRRLYRLLDQRIPDAPAESPTCHGTADGGAVTQTKNCGAGSSGIAVDPFGNVYPCIQWRRPLGNLHERSIGEIWRDSPALGEIRRTSEAARRQVVELGTEGIGLSHCMGLSEEKTGDPLALDPQAVHHAQLLREVRNDRALLPVLP